MQKLRWTVCSLLFAGVVFFALPTLTAAHELLPRVLIEYMQQHPNASAEEVEQFLLENDPNFAKKYKAKDDIIRLVKNQDTNIWDNAWDFLKLGVGHILSGPDHILFILSLLLVFLSLHLILRLTITFTLAHSITLILAGTGILVLSSSVVEPLIALSIVYVAVTSVFLKHIPFFADQASKVGTVFFFGLFHGLGFAGLLKEIQIPSDKFISSLLSFNLGIELGQLCIVAVALPFIFWLRRYTWYPRFIQLCAALIGVVGLVWVVQRISYYA